MAKVKWGVASRRRRKRLIREAKGYWGARRRLIRRVKETVMRARAYRTRDRKAKKRTFRNLWVIRLNAVARAHELTYSTMMGAFKRAQIGLNRKQLAELAIHDQGAFEQLLAKTVGAARPKASPVGARAGTTTSSR